MGTIKMYYTIVLIIGTPKIVPLILGNSHLGLGV